jgi:hypothetical protein
VKTTNSFSNPHANRNPRSRLETIQVPLLQLSHNVMKHTSRLMAVQIAAAVRKSSAVLNGSSKKTSSNYAPAAESEQEEDPEQTEGGNNNKDNNWQCCSMAFNSDKDCGSAGAI